MIDFEPDLEVVAEAADGAQTLEAVRATVPDVVLLDLSMPGMDGYATARELARSHPTVRIVVLTMHKEPQQVAEMLAAGAAAYLLKNAAPGELAAAIRAVAAGHNYLQAEVTAPAVEALVGRRRRPDDSLTARERDVVRAIASGKPVDQVAAELFISVRTVRTHRQNAMRKLDVHNVRELIMYALKEGIVVVPGPHEECDGGLRQST
jgi:DNA-binding NarL/FixJ family response regulator